MGRVDLRYEVAQNAYIKLVIHSLKHPTSAVNDILIGRISPSNDTVEIVEAVPLFHSHIPLLPQLEISLILVLPLSLSLTLSLLGFYAFFSQSDPNWVFVKLCIKSHAFLNNMKFNHLGIYFLHLGIT